MKEHKIIFLLILISIFSCSRDDSASYKNPNYRLEHSIISRGNNFPDFNPYKDSLELILTALHQRTPHKAILEAFNWIPTKLDERIKFLQGKGWIGKNHLPTIFIALNHEGEALLKASEPIAEDISASIKSIMPKIYSLYNQLSVSKEEDFNGWSFFILSNVLLDNYQIDFVESKFLMNKERPLRNHKNYFYSIIENKDYPKQKFGIYGNYFRELNDSLSYGIYGNNRLQITAKLKDQVFLDSLMNQARTIRASDIAVFKEMAHNYSELLLSDLRKNEKYIRKIYRDFHYDQEISFDEFFIWWYHFIYTKVTNNLSERGVITLPKDGNFVYKIVK